MEPHLGTGRWVDISAQDIAGGTSPDRRVGSSGGASWNPTCGGGGSKSGTSSGRRLPSELKRVSFLGNKFNVGAVCVISAKLFASLISCSENAFVTT